MSLTPGATLGRYQILEELGQGGMATVYKAFQPALERTVALKVIRRGFAEDPEFRERFGREAKAIARLTNPNIVQVHDFDEADGQVFLAMQYVPGGTLKERLARLATEGRRLPQEDVARIVREVAAALEYAHRHGVIHRDVKPSNVMLTEEGGAVVTDFGIAKIVGGTQHTATGVGIGTPEYMSPEQGQGMPLDGSTDQYALAVMTYEMLTGVLPYTGDTPFAVVLKHVRDPLPLPSSIAPDVSTRTEQVLLRALAKDPAGRYPSTTEFAEDLGRAIAERAPVTLPTLPLRRPAGAVAIRSIPAALRAVPSLARLAIIAVAGLVLIFGGAAVVVGMFGREPPILPGRPAPSPGPVTVGAAQQLGTPTATPSPLPTPTSTPFPMGLEVYTDGGWRKRGDAGRPLTVTAGDPILLAIDARLGGRFDPLDPTALGLTGLLGGIALSVVGTPYTTFDGSARVILSVPTTAPLGDQTLSVCLFNAADRQGCGTLALTVQPALESATPAPVSPGIRLSALASARPTEVMVDVTYAPSARCSLTAKRPDGSTHLQAFAFGQFPVTDNFATDLSGNYKSRFRVEARDPPGTYSVQMVCGDGKSATASIGVE